MIVGTSSSSLAKYWDNKLGFFLAAVAVKLASLSLTLLWSCCPSCSLSGSDARSRSGLLALASSLLASAMASGTQSGAELDSRRNSIL